MWGVSRIKAAPSRRKRKQQEGLAIASSTDKTRTRARDAEIALKYEIEDFLCREADLLDNREYEAWLDLMMTSMSTYGFMHLMKTKTRMLLGTTTNAAFILSMLEIGLRINGK